jgi:hypothetical protein
LEKIFINRVFAFQQARSRDLPSYSTSAQQILETDEGGLSNTTNAVREKCCNKMT